MGTISFCGRRKTSASLTENYRASAQNNYNKEGVVVEMRICISDTIMQVNYLVC